MKLRNVYTVLGFVMLVVMSISLVFSTLHSHHHIQWDHPGDFADTGNCYTNDTTVCPISGYLFQADITPGTDADYDFSAVDVIEQSHDVSLPKDVETLILGRAPPFAV